MKIFINASNLRFGGGKTVGMNLIDYYLKNDKIKRIILVAPVSCGYEIFRNGNPKLKIIFFPKIFNFSVFKIFSNYVCLPLLSLLFKNDFILSLGNIAFPSFKPQLVLIHQSFLAYPESPIWQRIKDQDPGFYFYLTNMLRFIRVNLRHADFIGVQTQTMKMRIGELFKIEEDNIFVIPNAVSFTSEKMERSSPENDNCKIIKLLFLSKYYPHKNFEILYKLGEIIKERKLPISFTTTIDEDENEGGRKFLSEINRLGLDHIVLNIGNVKLSDISKEYGSHNGLFLPTLLESFSGTYIEAMYFDKPIFTSNMDFAVDVCKDAAFYFDPLNAEDIVTVISKAFEDPDLLKSKTTLGKKYIQNTKSWSDIGKFIDHQILKL